MSSESGERCKAILDGVVSIADKLAVNVVVEGVETRDDLVVEPQRVAPEALAQVAVQVDAVHRQPSFLRGFNLL